MCHVSMGSNNAEENWKKTISLPKNLDCSGVEPLVRRNCCHFESSAFETIYVNKSNQAQNL